MKLYYTPGVCSLASHIAARELDIALTLVKVDSKTKLDEHGADYRAINSNGYVPALALDSGEILTEGPAIMQYLADLRPAVGLAAPAGSMARYRLQSLLNYITSEIHKGFAPLFDDVPPEVKEKARVHLGKRLDYVDAMLRQRETLLEDGYSLADIYLFVTAGWTAYVGMDLSQWPGIQALRSRMMQRPAVRAAMVAEGLIK